MRSISIRMIRLALLGLVAAACGAPSFAQDAALPQSRSTIALDRPDPSGGKPLMQALNERRTTRELTDAPLTRAQLSALLWAADGVNRPGQGGRTAPSALAIYLVDIYVVLEEGVYRYEPAGHRLVLVADGDHRRQSGTEGFVSNAPVNLVYVADYARARAVPAAADVPPADLAKWAAIEAGCLAQNAYLYCASEGLGAVVRVSVDPKVFGKVAALRPDQEVLAAQTVGRPR